MTFFGSWVQAITIFFAISCFEGVGLVIVTTSARISKKVEGGGPLLFWGIDIEIGYFLMPIPFLRGGNTHGAVIVPGTTIASGGKSPPRNSSTGYYHFTMDLWVKL